MVTVALTDSPGTRISVGLATRALTMTVEVHGSTALSMKTTVPVMGQS